MLNKIKKIPGAIVRRVKILHEKMNGLDFTKSISVEQLGFTEDMAKPYDPSSTYDLNMALNQLNIQPTDTILDYGSGKGLAIVTMSKFNFKLIGGVELSKPLAKICKKNISTLGIKNTEIFNCDARELKELDPFTHFYFFNPFPGSVLKVVLQNIVDSCQRKPRKIKLIYYCPRHRDVIDNHPFFEDIGVFKGKYFDTVIYSNI